MGRSGRGRRRRSVVVRFQGRAAKTDGDFQRTPSYQPAFRPLRLSIPDSSGTTQRLDGQDSLSPRHSFLQILPTDAVLSTCVPAVTLEHPGFIGDHAKARRARLRRNRRERRLTLRLRRRGGAGGHGGAALTSIQHPARRRRRRRRERRNRRERRLTLRLRRRGGAGGHGGAALTSIQHPPDDLQSGPLPPTPTTEQLQGA